MKPQKSPRRRISASDRNKILNLTREGMPIFEIANDLGINGQVVNGVVSSARNRGALPPVEGPKPKCQIERTHPPDGILGVHHASFSREKLIRKYGLGTYKLTRLIPGLPAKAEIVTISQEDLPDNKPPTVLEEVYEKGRLEERIESQSREIRSLVRIIARLEQENESLRHRKS